MGNRPKVHYNIRHIGAGRPVPYCHAVCETHEVSMHVREVTCTICCDFIDGFSVAVAKHNAPIAQVQGARRGGMVLAAFLAAGVAASVMLWQRYF